MKTTAAALGIAALGSILLVIATSQPAWTQETSAGTGMVIANEKSAEALRKATAKARKDAIKKKVIELLGAERYKQVKDQVQIKQIHQSWLICAREFEGKFPMPGLIKRDKVNGNWIPGRGEILNNKNDTPSLFSACIMANYFTPTICIGATEPSGKFWVMDDYNYEEYRKCGSYEHSFWGA